MSESLKIQPYTFDEELIEATRNDSLARLAVHRPDRVGVVLGRGSRIDAEIYEQACLRDAIPVMKRRGGGCAVVLDPGNVIVSLVVPAKGISLAKACFARISRWLIAGLDQAGIRGVACRGISDLALGDRKIGGACIYRSRGFLYYSTTLLVRPDLKLVERYLKHPPREPDYRAGRSHAEFMGRLNPDPWPGGTVELAGALRRILRPGLALEALSQSG
jgi:lipoate-protein ligase A